MRGCEGGVGEGEGLFCGGWMRLRDMDGYGYQGF